MDVITRKTLLELKKAELKKDPNCYKGNTSIRKQYVALLDNKKGGISELQKQTMLGMILSDASFDDGSSKNNTARLKMQQNNEKNSSWLVVIREILDEYTVNIESLNSVSSKRKNMVEFDTIKCQSIAEFVGSMFDIKNKIKYITNQTLVKKHLGPVAVATWCCGDGTKADHGPNKGKQIEFSTQGFTKEDVEFLTSVLCENFNIQAETQYDYTDPKGIERFRIRVDGPSFDVLARKIAPFIPPGMGNRLPEGRSEKSPFGTLTKEELKNLLGSQLKDIEALNETYL